MIQVTSKFNKDRFGLFNQQQTTNNQQPTIIAP